MALRLSQERYLIVGDIDLDDEHKQVDGLPTVRHLAGLGSAPEPAGPPASAAPVPGGDDDEDAECDADLGLVGHEPEPISVEDFYAEAWESR